MSGFATFLRQALASPEVLARSYSILFDAQRPRLADPEANHVLIKTISAVAAQPHMVSARHSEGDAGSGSF